MVARRRHRAKASAFARALRACLALACAGLVFAGVCSTDAFAADQSSSQDGPVSTATSGMLQAAAPGKVRLLQDGKGINYYDTLQDAVDQAIVLYQSSKVPYTVRIDADITIDEGEAVTVKSENGKSVSGMDLTFTSNNGSFSITRGYENTEDMDALFNVYGGAIVRFESIVVDGARDTYAGGKYGGLVYASDAGTRVIMDKGSVFCNSSSRNQGGAAYVRDGAAFEMHANAVGENCSATVGGFVSVHNARSAAKFIAQDAILRDNSAENDGGAVFARGSAVELSGNTHMYGNAAGANGWAVFAGKSNTSWTSVSISGATTIVDNRPLGNGSGDGGGVALGTPDGNGYSTLTVWGSPVISSNRWNNGDKANVVAHDFNQIVVGSEGFETNATTGMPAARVGVRIDGHAARLDQFAVTEGAATSTSNLIAFTNDLNTLYAGVGYGSNQVLWSNYTPVCKIVRQDGTYLYPTITDAVLDANTKFRNEAVTVEMLVADYDFRYEFYYPETIIEPSTGSIVPRNYQGIVCANPNGITFTKARADAPDGYVYNGGTDITCRIHRYQNYTTLDGNEHIDLYGSMFRVQGDGVAATLTISNVRLDGSYEPYGVYGRYGSFVFVVAYNHLTLDAGAVLENGHVAPIETDTRYYQTRSGDGGAVYAERGATVTLQGGASVSSCSASRNGGGIFMAGLADPAAIEGANTLTIKDGAGIANCSAGASGGGAYLGDGGGAYLGDNCTLIMSYSGSDLVGDGVNEVREARMAGKVASVTECSAAGNGGGVRMGKSATVDCTGYWEVTESTAGSAGGGVWLDSGAKVTLGGYNDDLARIGYNEAPTGGGLYAGANSAITMNGESCMLENSATAGNGGSAYLAESCKLTLTGSGDTTRADKRSYISRSHSSGGNGGGIYASEGCDILLGEYTQVSFNGYHNGEGGAVTATADGGGIYAVGSTISVVGSVNGNMAANGAGVYLSNDSRMRLSESARMASNSASQSGGAVFVDNAGSGARSVLQMRDSSSIAGNSAGSAGGGVFVEPLANMQVSGSVVVSGNEAGGSANNVYLPLNADESRTEANGRSEEVQVIGDLTSLARIGIWSTNDPEAYEQFGERVTLSDDGWTVAGTAKALDTANLRQFYNDRNSLRGTWGDDEEAIWGVNLLVEKVVSGGFADLSKTFSFTISCEDGAGLSGYTVKRANGATEAHELDEDAQVASITCELGNGDSVLLSGVYGTRAIRVTETVEQPYELTVELERVAASPSSQASGTGALVYASATHDVTGNGATPTRALFTNEYASVPPTGLDEAAIGWVILEALAAGGTAAYGMVRLARRRARRDGMPRG